MFINDLAGNLKTNCLLFADYTKIFTKIDELQDQIELQTDGMDSLSAWCNDWLMEFNAEKCKVMHIDKIMVVLLTS